MDHDEPDMDFAELFEASGGLTGEQSFSPGERVKGKVVLVTGDTVFIDYGAKSEGWADLEEFLDEKGEVNIKPGSDVELAFIGYGPSGAQLGSCLRKASGGGGDELLRKAFESKIAIEGTVTGTNKGGLEVTISGTKVFCPFSQMDLTYCDRPEVFVGTIQKFKVVQFEEEGKNIVVSQTGGVAGRTGGHGRRHPGTSGRRGRVPGPGDPSDALWGLCRSWRLGRIDPCLGNLPPSG